MADKYWNNPIFSCLRQKNEAGFYQATEQHSIKYAPGARF